ncbi:ATP-binding protein [Thalassospira sp. MCCC 1A03138]|uniref:ATP-binding protein n=1 Tax=Thalassospira sp. MCCC 1A03138 TaxID=1470576 RepID=UPI000A1DD89A|nr:ATP-binding protein [Thalassospira sp. MCCC 1A03138]
MPNCQVGHDKSPASRSECRNGTLTTVKKTRTGVDANMPKMLSLPGVAFLAFCAIAPVFLLFSSLDDDLVSGITVSVLVVVEFIALLSMCIGWILFDITKRKQIFYLAAAMGVLLISDLLGIPNLLAARSVLGQEQALGSFTGLLVLVLRLGSFWLVVMSWHVANRHESRQGNDQVWAMVPGLIIAGVAVQAFLVWFMPGVSSDVSGALQNISTLILFPTTIMIVAGAAGYLVRCHYRFSLSESLICFTLLIGCFNHLAFFVFGPEHADIVARFIIPSRLISYSFALAFMLLELRSHYRQSFQASSAKSEFLATMSHEIRTPLNGILGMAQLLRQSQLDDAQKERVSAILSSGRALMALLNDILDMSKIEAGRVELEKRPFHPSDITYDLFRAIADMAREKNLSLHCDDAPLATRMFIGDEVRFRQILWNLLSNAVKFTRKGSVRLEVTREENVPERVRDLIANEEVYHFAVIDTGIGIPQDRQEQIFSPFSQADNSTMRQYGGTGLGLSIARSLTELMGGFMMVDSTEGKGTRFDVWLPFEARQSELHEHGTSQIAEGSGESILSGSRILVAEDNEINANVIRGLLLRHGLVVDIVPNGREAVHAFQRNDYDAILMDAHMPVLDGEGATRHIRELERVTRGGRIPIICVTAEAFSDRHRDFLAAGMDEVMTKPVEERRLYSVLLRFLRRCAAFRPAIAGSQGKEAAAEVSVLPLPRVKQPEPAPETYTTVSVKETKMDLIDKSRFDEMSTALGAEQMAGLIELLPVSYQEEREKIIAAIADGDRESLRRAAHTIKGMAANLAAEKLAADARQLELYEGDFDVVIRDRIAELDRLAEDTADAMRKALQD